MLGGKCGIFCAKVTARFRTSEVAGIATKPFIHGKQRLRFVAATSEVSLRNRLNRCVQRRFLCHHRSGTVRFNQR